MIIHKDTLIIASMCLSGVTFGLGNLDSFPYHIFIILLVGLTKFKYIDYTTAIFVLIVITLTAIIDIHSYDISLFQRQVMNYLSVIIGAAYLISYKPDINRVSKVILVILAINTLIGLLQAQSEIFTIFSNARVDETGQRGSVGLFSEPTSFGLFCVFSFLFAVINIRKQPNVVLIRKLKKILGLSLFAIFFVNKSSAAILLLSIFALLSATRSLKGFLLLLVVFTFGIYAYYLIPNSRVGIILHTLFSNDILYLLQIDGSINERLSAVIGPYYGVIKNTLLPSSAFEYRLTYLSMKEASGGFFWWGGGAKIMNYLGNIIYELSIFGLFLIYRYVFFDFKSKVDYVFLIMGALLLSNSVPLLHGYPLLLFGTFSNNLINKVRA